MGHIEGGGTAGGQTAKRIGFLDLLEKLFDPGCQAASFTNGHKSTNFGCFSCRQTEKLLAMEFPATMGAIRVNLALSIHVHWAGLMKESLPPSFLDFYPP